MLGHHLVFSFTLLLSKALLLHFIDLLTEEKIFIYHFLPLLLFLLDARLVFIPLLCCVLCQMLELEHLQLHLAHLLNRYAASA